MACKGLNLDSIGKLMQSLKLLLCQFFDLSHKPS